MNPVDGSKGEEEKTSAHKREYQQVWQQKKKGFNMPKCLLKIGHDL
jgi:hypothetical protein